MEAASRHLEHQHASGEVTFIRTSLPSPTRLEPAVGCREPTVRLSHEHRRRHGLPEPLDLIARTEEGRQIAGV